MQARELVYKVIKNETGLDKDKVSDLSLIQDNIGMDSLDITSFQVALIEELELPVKTDTEILIDQNTTVSNIIEQVHEIIKEVENEAKRAHKMA